jgi:exonuclease SbcD
MIRLLHLADVHIGMENYGRINPKTGLSTRLEDFCQTLDEAVDFAIKEQVDLVAIAGDVYKTRDPTPTHQREFAERIARLGKAEIPVVIVPGNHDIPLSLQRATSVEIFRTLELPGVTVMRLVGRRTIETRSGPVQVLAMPWPTRGQYLNVDEFKNQTIEELNRLMVEHSTAKLREEAGKLDPAVPSVVIGHLHVFGAKVGAERLLAIGTDPVYELAALGSLPNVDYVALGHIHKHQCLSVGQPPVVYAGSLNRVDFSEEEEPKGFVVAEIERGACDWEFHEVKARPFLTIDARAESDDPTREVLRAVYRAGERVREAVVRLRITTFRSLAGRLDEREIRDQLREAHFLLPFQIDYLDADRQRLSGEELQGKTPLELLDLYWEGKGVATERRATLARYARQFMEEAV